VDELIERARAAAQHSREYGPGTNAPLLDELAAALEAAREDALRLDALEAMVNESPKKAFLLHHGMLPSDRYQYVGLGLSNTGRTLRQAIDQARGKEVQDEA
jgi:hypothetical protein